MRRCYIWSNLQSAAFFAAATSEVAALSVQYLETEKMSGVLGRFYESVAAASDKLEALNNEWKYHGADPLALRQAIISKPEALGPCLAFSLS